MSAPNDSNSNSNNSNNNNDSNDKRKRKYENNNERSDDNNYSRNKRYYNQNNNNNQHYHQHNNNGGHNRPADEVNLKVLIPSYAAGGIIGRGGEKIAAIQKDSNVRMKMSKTNDYYPGTQERVCLITGKFECVMKAHDVIMEKFKDKPDSRSIDENRDIQMKVLIPNNTAGLLIGKSGVYIKQIKDESAAFVQISTKQSDLTERIVTIEGEHDKRNKALEMVIKKICDDPQYYDNSTNLSYADYQSSNNYNNNSNNNIPTSPLNSINTLLSYPNNLVLGLSKLNEIVQNNNASASTANLQLSGLNNLATLINSCGGIAQINADGIKSALRNVGFSITSITEIIDSITVLMNYGLISANNTNSAPAVSNMKIDSNTNLLNSKNSSNNTSSLLGSPISNNNNGNNNNSSNNNNNGNANTNNLLASSLLNNPNLGSLLQLLSNSLTKNS